MPLVRARPRAAPFHLDLLHEHPSGVTAGRRSTPTCGGSRRRSKQRLSPAAPFGIGLRLSARDARELLEGNRLDEFRRFLDDEGLYVALINGFPHGSFHRHAGEGGRLRARLARRRAGPLHARSGHDPGRCCPTGWTAASRPRRSPTSPGSRRDASTGDTFVTQHRARCRAHGRAAARDAATFDAPGHRARARLPDRNAATSSSTSSSVACCPTARRCSRAALGCDRRRQRARTSANTSASASTAATSPSSTRTRRGAGSRARRRHPGRPRAAQLRAEGDVSRGRSRRARGCWRSAAAVSPTRPICTR